MLRHPQNNIRTAEQYLVCRLLQEAELRLCIAACIWLPSAVKAMCVCSYVWRNSALLPVPASRKDVFQTSLGLAEKRSLWRFLKNTSDALRGQGPLKVHLSSSAPWSNYIGPQS